MSMKPVVGCNNHHFQPFMPKDIEEENESIQMAHILTEKLQMLLLRAKLHKRTHLRDELNNGIRLSLVYSMIKCHSALRDHLAQQEDVHLDNTLFMTFYE